MILRTVFKTKERLFYLFVFIIVSVSVIYGYLNYLQNNYKSVQWSGERCLSELRSVKYQLNVVTDFKKRLDKALADSQKLHEAEKTKFKDIMENCMAMQQQSSICQSQFEDLQNECKRVKEDYDKIKEEFEKVKSSKNNEQHIPLL